jgi:GAF domain-containing protein
MAAFAFQNAVPVNYYIRLDSRIAETETDHSLLLDAVRVETNAQSAVLYGFQAETFEVSAITARTSSEARVRDVGVTLSPATSRWLESIAGPEQGRPAADLNFEKFPEVLQFKVSRLVVVPLRTENRLFGLLALGRSADAIFDSKAIEVSQRAARLLTAVLERDSLQQKLVERKLVERARGILQQRRRLSEEHAYLLLRSNSRRRRMPMVELAREIIEAAFQTEQTHRWQPVNQKKTRRESTRLIPASIIWYISMGLIYCED